MCIGVPMKIVETDGLVAVCDGPEGRCTVSLALTGPLGADNHVLVHLGSAIRVMDADEAALVADALQAVMAAQRGDAFDHLIGDLIDRQPELPPHLRSEGTGEKGDEPDIGGLVERTG